MTRRLYFRWRLPRPRDTRSIEPPQKRAKELTAAFAEVVRELREKGMRDSDRIAALFNRHGYRTPWNTPWSADAVDYIVGPLDPN